MTAFWKVESWLIHKLWGNTDLIVTCGEIETKRKIFRIIFVFFKTMLVHIQSMKLRIFFENLSGMSSITHLPAYDRTFRLVISQWSWRKESFARTALPVGWCHEGDGSKMVRRTVPELSRENYCLHSSSLG